MLVEDFFVFVCFFVISPLDDICSITIRELGLTTSLMTSFNKPSRARFGYDITESQRGIGCNHLVNK